MNRRPFVRWGLRALAVLLALLVLAAGGAWWAARASLPQLDGEIRLAGLSAPLTIHRDALGTAVLQGADRVDLARGLGFVHAQERFFEMDLTRRSAAGELSALFGPLALERDKARRLHRMRARLAERFASLSEPERALLTAYTAGVNAGLAQFPVRPWQYLLLRAEPRAWREVDSLLVIAEMFFTLQASSYEAGFER
ncbi:MAG TPA: penicillin acylase family protein, partial [Ideonella sp.]|nr:penicillin acylase family protein [Ideonella sp.]